MAKLDFTVPTDPMLQLLTGAVFAESSTRWFGGEDAPDKEAIAWSILNMSHFATVRKGTHNYNRSFGDGTVLSAIRHAIVAYGSARWNLVMNGNQLKAEATLERLEPADVEHLRLTIEVVTAIGPAPRLPHALASLSARIPVQFNQATDSPPSAQRQEKIGRHGKHTFYAFKTNHKTK